MATHDYVIDNSTGANVRTDINNVLQAILTNNSNSSAPSTTAAYMLWADTTANIVKIRNSANNAWINLFTTAGGIDVDAASNFNEDVTFAGASYNVVWDKSDNALEFADNAKAVFGTGNDLQIYHNGSNTFIDNSTGITNVRGGTHKFRKLSDNEDMLILTPNGAVELYYDNSLKFKSTNAGAQLTGSLAFMSESTNISILDNGKAKFGNSDDLQIYHDGTNSILLNNTGVFYLKTLNGEFSLVGRPAGATELYYDHSKKIETTADGVTVNGVTVSTGNIQINNDTGKIRLGASQDFEIYHDGGHSTILDNGTGNLKLYSNGAGVDIQKSDGENLARFVTDGAVFLYYDNNPKLQTQSGGISVTGECTPTQDDNYNLGHPSYRWDNVYATNGTIQTSDRNEKNTIVESDLGLEFVNELKPVSYKFNNKTRTHYGLIAQDLEEVLEKKGKSLDDFAGIVKNKTYGLNYSELISPLIKAVQELSAKVAALEAA